MAEAGVLRTVVVEDPEALVAWLAERHPASLEVDPEFVAVLARRGLIVERPDEPEKFDLIAPTGEFVPGVWIKAPELPEGEGTAYPEDIDG